jgi:HD-GYP domain-containing protein (c-di-GMP phosphodiesterase class II)
MSKTPGIKEVASNIQNVVTTLPTSEALLAMANELKKVFNFDRLSLSLLREDKQSAIDYFVYTGHSNFSLPKSSTFSLRGSMIEEVLRTRNPVIANDKALKQYHMDTVFRGAGMRSGICLPLFYVNELIGTLCMGSHQPGAFSEEHISLWNEVSPYITVMAENARLTERIKESETRLESLIAEKTGQMRRDVENLKKAQLTTAQKLAELAEKKDPEVGEHIERIRRYCVLIARELAETEEYEEVITPEFICQLYEFSPLHDIGKLGIPDDVLLKKDRLTEEEFTIIKQHTLIGVNLYEGAEFPKVAKNIALYHHERWDGKGYPKGLQGESIPLEARIVAVADVFDALTSDRAYRKAMPINKATTIIKQERGKGLDPHVVDAFLNRLEELILVRQGDMEVGMAD